MRIATHIRLMALAIAIALFGCTAQPAVPGWASCNEHTLTCNTYEVALRDWRVYVTPDADSGSPYLSPEEWRVQDALAVDVDRDGITELVLLSWRQSNFGTSTPFWKENDTTTWTQHLFILRPTATELQPVWMTSDMGMEVSEIHAQDGRIEIVERDGTHSLWEWLSWGLTLVE